MVASGSEPPAMPTPMWMETLLSASRPLSRLSAPRRALTRLSVAAALTSLAFGVITAAPAAQADTAVPAVNASWLDYYFNNKGIGGNGTGDAPNFDTAGNGFHRSNLITGGLQFGADVAHPNPSDASLTYRMGGDVVGAYPDNIEARGQTINTKQALGSGATSSATKIALVVASRNASDITNSPQYTLNYSDGTSESKAMPNVDWCSSSVPAGLSRVASLQPRYGSSTPCTIFITDAISLGGKKLDSITLPDESRIHLFAIASDENTSAATSPVTGTVSLPATLRVGDRLTTPSPSWTSTATPDSVTAFWALDGVIQTNSLSSAFFIPSSWQGKTVQYIVLPHRQGYRASPAIASAAVSVQASSLTVVQAPSIAGLARVADTLVVNPGSYATSLESPTSVAVTAISWKANGQAIAGATGTTFIPSAAQVGATITADVTVSKTGYPSITVTSAPTQAVLAADANPFPADPTNPVQPAPQVAIKAPISTSGSLRVGTTLSAKAGSFLPASAGVSYQWVRGAVRIPGATRSTYILTPRDLGAIVSVQVTATASGYQPTVQLRSLGEVASGAISVKKPVLLVGKKKVTGKTRLTVGKKVKAKAARATVPGSTATVTYQWYANGKKVSGKAGKRATLKVSKKLQGKRLKVKATYRSTGYAAKTVTSTTTAKVGR